MALPNNLCDREMDKFEADSDGDTAVRVIAADGSTFALTGFSVIAETTLTVGTTAQPLRVGGSNQTGRRVLFAQPKGGDVYITLTGTATAGDAGNAQKVQDGERAEIAVTDAVTPSIIAEVAGINTYVAEAK